MDATMDNDPGKVDLFERRIAEYAKSRVGLTLGLTRQNERAFDMDERAFDMDTDF